MNKHQFLAIDLGAESGRGIVITLADGKAQMEEIHRWPNRPVRLGGTLHWDFPFLFAEILHTLKICSQRSIKIESIGVDTWGVDFGLLCDGKLIANPVHYRDSRTNNIHDYSDKIMHRDDIFVETGYEPWQISSLFQLAAMKRDKSRILDIADTFLNMPDLFNYFLTGRKANERSIVNTSNLMDVNRNWSKNVIGKFGLPKMFSELIEPGTVLGELSSAISESTGLKNVPVVAVCGHDTSSALTAVPATGKNWAFLSCGTWSILGCLVEKPITKIECYRQGYTNEYTLGGWYLGRNILGLWIVQELRRKWNTQADAWDYVRMTEQARQAEGYDGLVKINDPALLAPADMEEALLNAIATSGQKKPETRGQLVRAVLESLALEYAFSMEEMAALANTKFDTLYLVGGGIANKLLCQFTADAFGKDIFAGADQCTAMGTGLTQARALNILTDNDQIRQVMRNSTAIEKYEPQNQSLWAQKRNKYLKLRSK